MAEVIQKIDDFVWGWFLIVLILGTGIFLSVLLKFLQVRKFGYSMKNTIVPSLKAIGKKQKGLSKKENSVSQFEAFATAISGTVGTGNIIGVTSAILTGGPGAVFWMWISAFFGMVTNYSENVLGLYFRKRSSSGDFSGGAFYYIENGIKWKKVAIFLAYLAASFCLLAAVGMSGVQTNKITETITSAVSFDEWWLKLILGMVVAIILALVILGGIKRIGKVASLCVPVMSLLFLLLSLIAIFMNVTRIPSAFAMIFTNIFSYEAIGGGAMGFVFSQVIKKGMARGVFSNEAGLGSSVIAHSASDTREPVKQGLWGIFEVFFDTFIICTVTALLILTCYDGTALDGLIISGASDSQTALNAFTIPFGTFGKICFAIILPMFAFTTILAWAYYGEKATEFIFRFAGEKGQKIAVLVFKIVYVLLTALSALLTSNVIWNISDIANALMAIPNLIALVILSTTVVKITKNYFDRKKGLDVEPMLSFYKEQNEQFKTDLKVEQETEIENLKSENK